jgi:precorrin-2 dehydrogenase / sirohydrochlorin ferrochelatase
MKRRKNLAQERSIHPKIKEPGKGNRCYIISLMMYRTPAGNSFMSDDPIEGKDTCGAFPPYPVFLRLEGKPCLVVGGGPVAVRKTIDLIECGAAVTVVAETPSPEMEELASKGRVILFKRRAEPNDLTGVFLIIAATDDGEVNASLAMKAREESILVNAVDNPAQCDFISGAVLRRGPLRIAVSTSGCGPLIAASIRRDLEELYDESFGNYVECAGELRECILSENRPRERKDEAIHWLAEDEAYDLFIESGKEAVWNEVRKILFTS